MVIFNVDSVKKTNGLPIHNLVYEYTCVYVNEYQKLLFVINRLCYVCLGHFSFSVIKGFQGIECSSGESVTSIMSSNNTFRDNHGKKIGEESLTWRNSDGSYSSLGNDSVYEELLVRRSMCFWTNFEL